MTVWLTVRTGHDAGRTIAVPARPLVIGRDAGCDLVLADPEASRRHAEVTAWPGGHARIRDLDSRNGTFVNGQVISNPIRLTGAEQILVGTTIITVSIDGVSQAARPVGKSTIERRQLRRVALGSVLTAVVAVGISAALVVLVITGVLPPRSPTVEQIVARVSAATVAITTSYDGSPIAGGSGWVLDAELGLVITNYHVVADGDAFAVEVGGAPREARLAEAAPCDDLAMLMVEDTSGLEGLELASQAELTQGETVIALGFPTNLSERNELTPTVGVVSVVRTAVAESGRQPPYPNLIQHDAAINPGNSGGPLVDLNMRLAGVNTLIFRESQGTIIEGQSYAIGVDRVVEVTDAFTTGTSLGWAGVGIIESAESIFPLPVDQLVVTGALPGTTSAEADIGTGPLILTAIDGTRLEQGMATYCELVATRRSGDTAVFSLESPTGTDLREVSVTFE